MFKCFYYLYVIALNKITSPKYDTSLHSKFHALPNSAKIQYGLHKKIKSWLWKHKDLGDLQDILASKLIRSRWYHLMYTYPFYTYYFQNYKKVPYFHASSNYEKKLEISFTVPKISWKNWKLVFLFLPF